MKCRTTAMAIRPTNPNTAMLIIVPEYIIKVRKKKLQKLKNITLINVMFI